MAKVILAADRAQKLRNMYPWVYADEVQAVEGAAEPGDVVEVQDTRGQWIGRAFFHPASHITARLLTLDPHRKIDRSFFEERLAAAVRRRAGRVTGTNALRLVHGEADEIPGLIVDRFAEVLVIQVRNAGVERFRDEIVRALKHVCAPAGIYERSDVAARAEEGLEPRVGLVAGEVPDAIEIFEDDLRFTVSVRAGQKTGFYLDQRDNRRLLGALVTPDSRVLDVYAYTGGFSLHAARAGAMALAVDKDAEALRLLEANARANGVGGRVGARWGDAPEVLASLAQEGRSFTHVVLDPPTLAKRREEVSRAKEVLAQVVGAALVVLEPQGILFLSTCAYHIAVGDLIEVTRRAATLTRRRVEVVTVTYQPADHPWILQIPETLYLKTIVLRVA